MSDVLLIVALRTDQPDVERRLRTIVAAAQPIDIQTEACAHAQPVSELTAGDLDRLAAIIGWDAVDRLNVGAVAAGT